MRSVYVGPAYVGPAPRGEAVWTEALFFPGEAPVLPVRARTAPVPGIRSAIV